VDAVVLNAGVGTPKFEFFEEDESTITVNLIRVGQLQRLNYKVEHRDVRPPNVLWNPEIRKSGAILSNSLPR
jgi:hypothetical protein